jgi:nucleoside phosphorylase
MFSSLRGVDTLGRWAGEMTTRRKAIHLDRRFFELTGNDEPPPGSLLPLARTVNWEQVLERPCTVVLGEAGTGKTTEFRQRCELLVGKNEHAFFLTIDELATSGLDESLTTFDAARLKAWLAGSARGYFFLDALDEARLNGQRFQTALRKLERGLSAAAKRSTILISCRVTDWRAQADREAIATALFPDLEVGAPTEPDRTEQTCARNETDTLDADLDGDGWADAKSEATPPEPISPAPVPLVTVYALAPLDERQIKLLAENLGITDSVRFIEAARRASAHAYLERPRDVEWLAAYWLQRGEFGTLTELVENDVQEKLQERNPDRKPSLSPARAREAAQVLAGIAALQRRSTFSLPDGDLDADRAATSIDPSSYLVDLTKQEIEELLSRPIFDESTYGRVRIHHRTVSEYLAAQWLLGLVQRGLSSAELHALLVRNGPSGPVVPQELVAVAAWVANTDAQLRRRLLEVAPNVLLDGGDPNALPDDARRDLLVALAARYKGRERRFERFDSAALRRLASGTLADTVNQLLSSSTSDELLDTLLTIVGEGGLVGCVEQTLRLARDEATPRYARLEAITAVAKIASPPELDKLLRLLIDDTAHIDHEVGGTLVVATYPTAMSVTRLLLLLARVAPPPPQTGTTLPYWLGHHVYNGTPVSERATLVEGVLGVAQISSTQDWLLDPLAQLAIQYSNEHPDSAGTVLGPLVRFFARMETPRMGVGDGTNEIRRVLANHWELRRSAFWEDVAVLRDAGKNPTRFFDLLVHDRLWALTAEDFEWLEKDALQQPMAQDRLLAFDTIAHAQVDATCSSQKQAIVLRLIASSTAFAKRHERWNRPSEPSTALIRLQRRQRMLLARREKEHERVASSLRDQLDQIRAGHHGLLEYLTGVSNLDGQEPAKGLQYLRKKYDASIAEATAIGCRNLWRTLECPLPHEEPERNRWLVITMAGFAGVTLDFESGIRADSLSADDARQAARFATRSMNRFPGWLEQLVQNQPSAVADAFGASIAADYYLSVDRQPVYAVLHLLGHASECVRELCAPIILGLLSGGDPPRFDALEQSLEALIPTPNARPILQSLAKSRCTLLRPTPGGDEYVFTREYVLWLCVWLAVDPEQAIVEIEREASRTAVMVDAFVEALCDQLHRLANDARIGFPFPDSSELLGRLFAVVATHIRPADDVRHIGTFSPGARDHAETLRRFVLDRLVGIAGDGTYLGLRRLAEDPKLSGLRDYLLALADQRVSQDVGKRDPDVADRLEGAFRAHGLKAIDHLEEAGLRTMTTANVDFGLITALPEERDAVLAQMPALKRLDKDGSDTHTYYEGTLPTRRSDGSVYRVVLVCCPSMGPQIAVQTADALLNRWKPRQVMLVGIAMGLEKETDHGDILIADQVADYTLGKQENGERIIRWKANQPGASLFDSAIAMEGGWSAKISVARPIAGSPEQIVGTIASGGDVVADNDLVADFLKRWPKLVGIEMEAGGVATAVHHAVNKPDFLMIKGVSDHGYDKNHPEVLRWRGYAAYAAAAFAIELMRSGPSEAIKLR